jgi:hypothetical protein
MAKRGTAEFYGFDPHRNHLFAVIDETGKYPVTLLYGKADFSERFFKTKSQMPIGRFFISHLHKFNPHRRCFEIDLSF